MKCRRAQRMLALGDAGSDAVHRHVAACAGCAHFADRLAALETAIAQPRFPAAPPPGFAAAVRARLPRNDDPLAWAAWRFLPATLVLVLLLSWLNLSARETGQPSIGDPTSMVLSWVIDPGASFESEP